MTEYAHLRATRRKTPNAPPKTGAKAERKPRKVMRKVSPKRQALMATVGPERRELKEQVGCCMICRKPFDASDLDCDEIARGPAREKCLNELTLIIVSCRKCHGKSQDWPPEKRIAVVVRWDIEQRCKLYCELRGLAPTAVVASDVHTYISDVPEGNEVTKARACKHTILPTLNLRDLRWLAIGEAMARCGGNHEQAAKLLGVCTKTIQRRLDERGGDIQPYSERSRIC